ncbi:dihydrofolate reductase [Hymenobacter sp. DG25B]|nr:dihydrofolate reductase [Hymenobacter sp. DG25B]
MRKLISFMHISLDGFVSGPNGEMNWITVNEEIFAHIDKRISKTDTAAYGRATYQMMESYWPKQGNEPDASQHDIDHSTWYNHVHKVVVSNSMQGADLSNTIIINGNLAESLQEIKQQGDTDILLFGSPTATHSLMQQNLIDGFWLFVNPVILGQGIPLFTNVQDKIKLKLLTTQQFTCGVTELSYIVDK